VYAVCAGDIEGDWRSTGKAVEGTNWLAATSLGCRAQTIDTRDDTLRYVAGRNRNRNCTVVIPAVGIESVPIQLARCRGSITGWPFPVLEYK